MIDFRYHIVSLVAVFLALALGILLGSSVIQGAVIDRLESDIRRYRESRDEALAGERELRGERDALGQLLKDGVAPFAIDGRLEGVPVLLVTHGERPRWGGHVTDALRAADAVSAGAVVLAERWKLGSPEDVDDLVQAVRSSGSPFEPGRDPAADALRLLGRTFLEPAGARLIGALEEARFVSVEGRPDEGAWPPPSAAVVVLSSSNEESADPLPVVSSFVRALSESAPTLVATDGIAGRSLVSELRELRADVRLPPGLATFRGATSEADPGGVGVVAALVAATEGRGGDYGARSDDFPPRADR